MPSSAVPQKIDYSTLDVEQIGEMVKNARMAKGYTQKELSDLAGINLRSLQRIENANVKPRSYTLKQLEHFLTFEIAESSSVVPKRQPKSSNLKKVILSLGSAILSIIIAAAFLAQSATFPETTFEFLILIGAFVAFYMLLLLRIWR
ncbi:helix-turn-helix transcriptional regulator [Pedobacter sp.]|uniref:helix-turn-helix domain-containing protein n=1 Tax=Pedobacter sp. TaxID=1411316 RepID=UPI0031E46C7E